MDCPACKSAMITLELAEVEIDHCQQCKGIWLDRGELESLLGENQKVWELLDSFKPAQNLTEKTRKCPICLKKMDKTFVGKTEHKILIDKCGKGDGIWFDNGELKSIVKLAAIDKENRILNLLAEMFAESK